MRRLVRHAVASCGLMLLASMQVNAQAPDSPAFRSLDELNAFHHNQAVELDRRKLIDLGALAKRSTGEQAEEAYRAAFDLAVAKNFYNEADSIARAYLEGEAGSPQSYALAASIALVARANRGEYDRSLTDLETFLKRRAAAPIPDDQRLSPSLVLAIGEAYLRRLIEGGRSDIALRVCELARGAHPDSSVKAYFEQRRARLGLIGKPAPAIGGTDVDGKAVRFADLKGKVVLVDFWATWCPPCVSAFPGLRSLEAEYKDQGFVILGVNLDELADAEGEKPKAKPEDTLAAVRWLLLSQRAGWANLIGPGAAAAAKAYGVDEIPARFLIGPDGTVAHVELEGEALRKAVGGLVAGIPAKH